MKGWCEIYFCISGVAPDDQQPLEGSEGGHLEQNSPNASAAPQVSFFWLVNVVFLCIKDTGPMLKPIVD